MNDNLFNLDPVPNDDLNDLTESLTELIDVLQRIEKRRPGTFPAGIVNTLIMLEAECCVALDQRGILPEVDDDSRDFQPVELPEPDPRTLSAFADFIDHIDFDAAGDDDNAD